MNENTADPGDLYGFMHADTQAGGAGAPGARPSAPPSTAPRVAPDDLPPATRSYVFTPTDASLTDTLPAHTALLCVTATPSPPGERRRFRLAFHFDAEIDESSNADLEAQQVPDLSLTQIADRGQWRRDFFEMAAWWVDLAHLRYWMSRLAATRDGNTRLIVWDNTDHQIPWELVHLGDGTAEDFDGWLGASVEILRWTSIHHTGRSALYSAPLAVTKGEVAVLETPDVSPGQTIAKMARGVLTFKTADMKALVGHLGRDEENVALVIVHCHGISASNGSDFTLAGTSMNELERMRMPTLARSHSVVLLNACNTAKIVPSGPHSSRATRSFAELFLRKGASSVIATLGRVSNDHTTDFAYQLIHRGSPDHRIARLLLSYRAEALRNLRDAVAGGNLDDAACARFLYSFMYVDFGHPDSILVLTSQSGGHR